MSRILRLSGRKPWVEAAADHRGHVIDLAVHATHPPIYAIADTLDRWPSFERHKRRDGGPWWTVRIEVPYWVGTLRFTLHLDGVAHEWQTDVLPEDGPFPDARAAVDRLVTRLIESHAHLPWGATGAIRAADLDEAAGTDPAPPRLHVAALDAVMPRLHRALAAIERRPLHVLAPARARRPVERATRVDAATLTRLGDRPELAEAIRHRRPYGGHLALDVPLVDARPSHPANRALLAALRRLDRALDDAMTAVDDWRVIQRGKGSADRKADADHLIARITRHRDALTAALRRVPWRGLEPGPVCPTAAQVFADDPTYSEAMRSVRRLIHPAVRPQLSGLVDASLRALFDLWEQYVWCRVVRVVRATLGAGWRWQPPPVSRVGLAVGAAPDTAAEATRDGWRVHVGSQRIFRAARAHAAARGSWHAGRFSLNGKRIPDVTVEVQSPDGITRWLVLDAKFTHRCQPIEAEHLPVAHTYRDGLRIDGRAPDAVYLVAPAVEASAACYASDAYRTAFETGVIVDPSLTRLPGDDTPLDDYRPLARWLEATLPAALISV